MPARESGSKGQAPATQGNNNRGEERNARLSLARRLARAIHIYCSVNDGGGAHTVYLPRHSTATAELPLVAERFGACLSWHLIAMYRQRFLEGVTGAREWRRKSRSGHSPRSTASACFQKAIATPSRYLLPGRLTEVLPSLGVLRRSGQQPADGLLPGGDPEAGGLALRNPLPEPLREPQRRGLHHGG